MDVGKLFKLPSLPSSAVNKRKAGLPADMAPVLGDEVPKRARIGDGDHDTDADADDAHYDAVHSVVDVDANYDGVDNEGDGGDDVYGDDDDEEGRFFGSGLTDEQQQILKIMNEDSDASERRPEEQLADVRRQLLQFEKTIAKNQEMRLKYPDAPDRFIASEADLDADIRGLAALTSNCALFYPELVKLGAAELAGLLAHENVDISGAVVSVLEELTDEDVLDGEKQDEDSPGSRALAALAQVLLEHQVLELLVSNLARFNDILPEGDAQPPPNFESDVHGVYHTLGVIENLVSLDDGIAKRLVSDTPLISWLLNRMRARGFDQNKAYAGELLSIVLQSARDDVAVRLGEAGGIDTLLVVLSRYRRRHHLDAEETEYVENCFSTLAGALLADENKGRFLQDEGVELMLLVLRERPVGGLRALQVLDHALGGGGGAPLCERLVDAGGLGVLFATFMERGKRAPGVNELEHIFGIIASLLHGLPSDSAHRLRVLAKFVEQDYAKTKRLLELRAATHVRVGAVEKSIAEERRILDAEGVDAQDEEELFYLRRLEGGAFSLQLIDYILAWLIMEDDDAAACIRSTLGAASMSVDAVVETLVEYESNASNDGGVPLKDILGALIAYIKETMKNS
ncbi:hypothetical protein MCUN1_003558 [Malassezia cuniculi]|uniref:Beta-catenin-like protein 1 N-terminal domain-containing protein n=1 Tax=Malassezia cuniculi TaxID=948313 RepID=A0AAF0EYN0_9BASI|nr:hypothetical protein MCUN1_003558 [Malassezia cuniculi]